MKHFKSLTLIIIGYLLLSPMANAVEVNLQWQEPEKFRDIQAGNLVSQKHYQQRVLDELGKYIRNSANEYLPENHRFDMTVTNVDLAGDVEYFFTRFPTGIRVLRNLYFPSIEFTYELTDGQGTVLKRGQENVQDIGYQYSGVRMVRNAPLGYEKRMINEWFRENFSDS